MKIVSKTKGFTLIELIIVIVLLGILSANALPRFVDFSDTAVDERYENFIGAYKTGINMFHAKWRVSGEPSSGALAGFGTLQTNNIGYPIGSDGTFETNSTDHDDCLVIAQTLVPDAKIAQGTGSLCSWSAICGLDETVYDFATYKCANQCELHNISKGIVSGVAMNYYSFVPSTGAFQTHTNTPNCSN